MPSSKMWRQMHPSFAATQEEPSRTDAVDAGWRTGSHCKDRILRRVRKGMAAIENGKKREFYNIVP